MPEGALIGAQARVFLFLQGPHGPFFARLAEALADAGAEVRKISFNAADTAEWRRAGPVHRYSGRNDAFEEWFEALCDRTGATDIVLYGDTRIWHRIARQVAARRGIIPHCFEEGYLRPHWITYEREGCNANSRLSRVSVPRMAEALGEDFQPAEEAPATWGDSRQHRLHSIAYHLRLLLSGWLGGAARSHREMPVWRECLRYALRAIAFPPIAALRAWRQRRLLRSSKVYHLALLQLSFDSAMRDHSDFTSSSEFAEQVIDAFAAHAPRDEYLVLKAHPFEDGRERLGRIIRELARDLGVSDRVIFIDGGKKLAALLDRARSAITVNSTAAQQALWRGLPVKALGRAIYRKPGLVSEQSLGSFMAHPIRPDMRAYRVFRRFLLETSQLRGSFYASAGIAAAVRELPQIMLEAADPYDRTFESGRRGESATQPAMQPIRLVI